MSRPNPEYHADRGSAAIPSEHHSGYAAHLINLGPEVGIDLSTGALTPNEAKALGHALIAWGVWRQKTTPTIDHYQRTGGL